MEHRPPDRRGQGLTTTHFFRKEVFGARRVSWMGRISLENPVSAWMVTALCVSMALAVAAFVYFGEYARRNRVTGQLVPTMGLPVVSAPVSGTLGQVRVKEGDMVRQGEILAVMQVPRSTLSAGDTDDALAQALESRRLGVQRSYASRRLQLQAQRDGLAEQLQSARNELDQVRFELVTRREQYQLAKSASARLRALHEKQYVTDLQLQAQEAATLEQLVQLQSAERQQSAARRMVAQLEQAVRELPAQSETLDAAEQQESAGLVQQSLEAKSRAQAVIKAPVSGTVSALLAQSGQGLQAGQQLMSIVPSAGGLQAQLLVPSRAIGFVEPGDSVLLRYQAYPYQKFGHQRGRVVAVSRSALAPSEIGFGSGAREPYYRVLVALDRQTVRAYGKDEALKPGLLLEADIIGERRALWEWLLEPIFTVSGRLGSE